MEITIKMKTIVRKTLMIKNGLLVSHIRSLNVPPHHKDISFYVLILGGELRPIFSLEEKPNLFIE